jgi:hypothetical protein
MRNVLCFALLVPVLALAAGSLRSETVVAPPIGPQGTGSLVRTGGSPIPPKTFWLGTVDTVGGTIYDWVANAQTYRFCINTPGSGLHLLWMYSNDTTSGQPDRNMRYQYYDYAMHTYNWLDPDFMLSGVNVSTARSGFGSLSADPTTGAAVVSYHQTDIPPIYPLVARDIAAGAGIFEYCSGDPDLNAYLWPPIYVGNDRTIHMHMVDDASRDNIFYSRAATWCTWDPPASVTPTAPTFPTNGVVASQQSPKVCLTWVHAEAFPYVGYYRLSSDGGTNWDPEVELGYPPVFTPGSDTTPSYYITSFNPFYDAEDRLHIIVDVMPIIRDTAYLLPIEIWDWCAGRTPEWSRVHRAEAESLIAGPGTNALFACRPMLGEDNDGNLFAVWEQFDVQNIDPVTNLMRADVWISGSSDGGLTWTQAQMVNSQGPVSYRSPSISNIAIDGGDCDTVCVLYLADSIAGPKAGASPVGVWSFNPMLLSKIPRNLIIPDGVAEGPGVTPARVSVSATPNPVQTRTHISYALPRSGDVSLVVNDVAGRPVKTLVSGSRQAGRHTVTLDAGNMAAGVYFYTLNTGATSVTKKLTVAH